MTIINLVLLVFLFTFSSCSKPPEQQPISNPERVIHTSQLAPGWYNQNLMHLSQELDSYFGIAKQEFAVPTLHSNVRALIVPHAGYYYAGLCAASAYQVLLNNGEKNKSIKRVIILAPNHTTFYNGIALPEYTVFRTVLGDLSVDVQALKTLKKHRLFNYYQEAHRKEHAIEMQLPLLCKTVDNCTIVPLVVGRLSSLEESVVAAKELQKIIDDQTLIIVSTDLTHYGAEYDYAPFNNHIYQSVRLLDSYAISTITQGALKDFGAFTAQTNATICGQDPITILLALRALGQWQSIDACMSCYYTSAQLEQARDPRAGINVKKLMLPVSDDLMKSSVSYAGIIFTENQARAVFSQYEKKVLLMYVHDILEDAFKQSDQQTPEKFLRPVATDKLMQPRGVFVTLYKPNHELRGCIGRIQTDEPLIKTIYDMTLAAAFHDSRFPPLKNDELKNLSYEISVLTPPEKVDSHDDIVLGKHGIILHVLDETGKELGAAVFLPHVPKEFNWTLEITLGELSIKAGFDADAWQKFAAFEVFEATEIK